MSTPHKCPVCHGTGRVSQYQGHPYWTTTTTSVDCTKECPACKGTCVVWEPVGINHNPFAPNTSPVIPYTNIPGLLLETDKPKD